MVISLFSDHCPVAVADVRHLNPCMHLSGIPLKVAEDRADAYIETPFQFKKHLLDDYPLGAAYVGPMFVGEVLPANILQKDDLIPQKATDLDRNVVVTCLVQVGTDLLLRPEIVLPEDVVGRA